MNIPTYAVPALSIGSTFDCNSSRNGIRLFPPDVPTKNENVGTFSFRYNVVTRNDEVRELLDLPFDLPLRIKANQLSVEGPGKYFNDIKTDQGKTEILVVMKCTTVSKKIEDSARPNEISKGENMIDGLGTHYVRRVSYGGQMIASIKLDFPSSLLRPRITGSVQRELTSQAVAEELSKQLNIMSTNCQGASSMSISYHTTEVPYQPSTPSSLQELIKLFENFSLQTINSRKEIPIEVELQPTETLIPSVKAHLPNRALANALEEVENRVDDLRAAQYLVKKHQETDVTFREDMKSFSHEVDKVLQIYKDTISTLNLGGEESQFDGCLTAYENALDGYDEEGKFVHFWRKLLTREKVAVSSIQLPQGKDLSLVVIGRPGSGKSATANSIVGKHIFTTTAWATSEASFECQFGCRIEERKIDVLDTPGVFKGEFDKEIPRILELAPKGFDAIILVAEYGCRLTTGDAEALELLQEFLGDEAKRHIILVVTYADQAKHEAEEGRVRMSLHGYQQLWLETLPAWVQSFIQQIDDRVVFFNNKLRPDSQPDDYKTQLSQLIQAIDAVTKTTSPYLQTEESRQDFIRKIREVTRKPTQKKRKDREDEWLLVPGPHDNQVNVPVGETRDAVATDDQGSYSERIRDFFHTYCRIF